jgi:hypothetical protein
MKICPVRAELLQADRQTDVQRDMTKLIAAFRNFANTPKNPPSLHPSKYSKIYRSVLYVFGQNS